MKKYLVGLTAFLMVVSFTPAVLAEEAQGDGANSENAALQNQSTSDVETSNDKSADREQRIKKYKELNEKKATAFEQRRIAGKCKGAQTVSLKIAENVSRVKDNRQRAYESITDKLSALIAKLQAAGIESTELQAAVEDLNTQSQTFLLEIDEYKTTIEDLSAMDCEADPEAFDAALKAAKEQRVALVSSSQALRKYLNETLKPILQGLREKLTQDDSADSEQDTEQPTEETDNGTTE